MSLKRVVDMTVREIKKMCDQQVDECSVKCPAYFKYHMQSEGQCELSLMPYLWSLKRLQKKYDVPKNQ